MLIGVGSSVSLLPKKSILNLLLVLVLFPLKDVFPRNLHICTRQPIVLTLRRDGAYEHDAPFVKVTLPALDSAENELVEEGISCERAREILQQRMDRLGELDNGMVIDKEIIVEGKVMKVFENNALQFVLIHPFLPKCQQ